MLQAEKQVNGDGESAEKRIAITLKLLEAPYVRMKTYGAINRRTNQSILEEALNDWLDKIGG